MGDSKDLPNVQDVLRKELTGKRFRLVTLGPAGVGKSTLVNTLLMRRVCQVGSGAASVTNTVTSHVITYPLQGDDTAEIEIFDSPGFTGSKRIDDKAVAELKQLSPPDLLLICFALDSDSGRYMPMMYRPVFDKIEKLWEGVDLKKRSVIVLTKANLVYELYKSGEKGSKVDGSTAEDPGFEHEVKNWKETYAKEEKGKALGGLPVCIAGRIEYGRNDKPVKVTKIQRSSGWLQDLWNTVAHHSGMGSLLYICLDNLHQDASLDKDVIDSLPTPSNEVLKSVAAYAAGALATAAIGGAAVVFAPVTAAGVVIAGVAAGAYSLFAGLKLYWGKK